jgi:aromatic-L-amino-acid decarboxylase
MPIEDFRAHGHAMIDFIADYWSSLDDPHRAPPVLSRVTPGQVAGSIALTPPEHGEDFARVMDDVRAHIMPGLTHWQSPGFFGFFPANTSAPGVLGELLSAGLGVNGMLWLTSPACTELEQRVMDWCAQMLGLPEAFTFAGGGGGVIQGTASEAALVALVAARVRAGHPKQPVIYCSSQAHSSITKAAMIAGVAKGPDDRTSVRLIDVDAKHNMRPAALASAIREDLHHEREPIFVAATLGTTSCMGFDDLSAIAKVLDTVPGPRPWLHVDGAFAGSACVCPEHRGMLAGIDRADSFCFNPHKWLLTNFDCDCLFVREPGALTRALSITPEYLRNSASTSGGVVDYRDWQVPLGRRFRALKLWFVIRAYGVEGLRAYIREHVRLGALFEQLITHDDRFEVLMGRNREMPLVVFALRAGDDASKALLSRVNARGKVYLTHTVMPSGRFALRMAIGGTFTREQHVRMAFDELTSQIAP